MRLKSFLFISLAFLFFGCDNVETQNSIESNITADYNSSIDTIQSDINNSITLPSSTTVDIDSEEENNTIINISETPLTEDTESQEEIETEIIPQIDENLTDNNLSQIQIDEEIDYKDKFINKDKCNQIIDKEFFQICYDYSLKAARSIAYTLEGDLVNELNILDRPNFYEEPSLDEEYRAKYSDYTNSGFDRGHLAPDASFDWSEESLEATYSLANIIPQTPKVNRYTWSKVEQYARDKAVELGQIDVINVVKYDENQTQYIGEDRIGVSIGFYKILLNKNESYQECFYYENNDSSVTSEDNVSQHKVDCNTIL